MKRLRRLLLVAAAVVLLGAATVVPATTYAQTDPGSPLLGFEGGDGWLNSPALTPADLRGKVVLVDFWEYTCVNCLRTLPYLREWYARYHKDGFVIVGVHTPEFSFSSERANVEAALPRLGVTWPVVLDDDYAIWKRYHNSIWPHEFLYDADGKLIENEVGEGNYQLTEAKIQAALKAKNPTLTFPPVMALLPQDSYTKPGSVCYPQTAEILVAPARGAPPVNATGDNDPSRDTNYNDPGSAPPDGRIVLDGYWHASDQAWISGGRRGHLSIEYHAIQVVAVLRSDGGAMHVGVMQDGKPVAREDAGADIQYDASGNSYLDVKASRAYDVIMNKHFGTHELTFSPDGDGMGFYDIAFESCEVGADK